MVFTQHALPPPSGQDSADIQHWLDGLSGRFAVDELAVLRSACEFAAPLYQSHNDRAGGPLLRHALGAATILSGLHLDHESVAAAILHAAPDFLPDHVETLTATFGAGIAELVEGIFRVEQITPFSELPELPDKDAAAQHVENLRMMLLAMVDDIRVVLIKLAERTQTLRSLAHAAPEAQRPVALEARNIFAPLANRLGVWQIKWEMEDLALRFLEPELYKKVAGLLDARRVDREKYIEQVVATLKAALTQEGIEAELSGRPKHISSIVAKMRRKQIEFSELYDVRAVRLLVNDTQSCYAALSVVHAMWPPIEKEFDDYIANPKPNGYRSLHTAVTGPNGLALEVQIRTRDMHHDSELGVAAHWRYKENKQSQARVDEKIAWLRQILAWKADLADSGELKEQFRNELLQDRVYVFTPLGKVIDLAQGATPVDFAYALHTDIGHRTRGAKVDGIIVPLKTKLQNGQRVEILTAKQPSPSRDWLRPQLGYLKSARARAKVRHWFKTQNIDESIAQGRTILERELHRLGAVAVNQEKLARRLNFPKLDDLLAALGQNDITPRKLANAIREEAPAKSEAAAPARRALRRLPPLGVLIEGESTLVYKLARCCQPEKPAPIAGYITRERGITIHRQDCPFLLRLQAEKGDRILSAEWV